MYVTCSLHRLFKNKIALEMFVFFFFTNNMTGGAIRGGIHGELREPEFKLVLSG